MPTNTKQIDFTKPFQFVHDYQRGTEYTCTPMSSMENYFVVSWKNGQLLYSFEDVVGALREGIWEIVKDNPLTTENVDTDFTKPFQFTWLNNKEIYTFTPTEGESIISWNRGDKSVTYTLSEVKINVRDGNWKLLPLTNENTDNTEMFANTQQEDAMKKLEEYIKAINKNVPEEPTNTLNDQPCFFCKTKADCSCGDYLEVPETSWTSHGTVDFPECFLCSDKPSAYDCGKYVEDCLDAAFGEPQETLLDAIKSFTLSTGASVFINDGSYEVYCFGLDEPFKAATDEEMWKLIEAVEMLEGAL